MRHVTAGTRHRIRTAPCWALLAALLAPAGAAEPVSLPHAATTLHGERVLAAGANPADGIVLLLHGTLASHHMELIQALQGALAEREISSLAVSLDLGEPGRPGMRDCTLPHRHRHEDAQAELAAWMGWLQREGAGKVTLLGHSRGGNQAAQFAFGGGMPLHALVLVAPATYDEESETREFDERHGQSLATLRERIGALPADTLLDDLPLLYCAGARATAASFLSYHGGAADRDTPSLLPHIDVPTLVIAGSEDTTVPDVAEKTTAHVDADTTLLVIDGADHFFRDFYAEDIADAVAALLADLRR